MKDNLLVMSDLELNEFHEDLEYQLEARLRNMEYDQELEKIYERLEKVLKEKTRRGLRNG